MKRSEIYNGLVEQLNEVTKDLSGEKGYKTISRYYSACCEFSKFLANEYKLEKFNNVKAKHIFAYVERMQENGKSDSTIRTALAGIRFMYEKAGGKSILPKNDRFDFDKRERGTINKAWTDKEIEKALDIAKSQGNYKIYHAIRMSSTFGLRIEETARLRPSQIKGGYLQIKGKGGKVRNVRIETKEEKKAIEELKGYIKENCKGKNDYILSMGDIKATKQSIEKWIERNRDSFTDKDRTKGQTKGKKPLSDTLSFHGLRYRYAQRRYEEELRKGSTEKKAKKTVSISLGHNRAEVTNIYLA
ncbi:MAG: tyrosine-type recombinase/integrase [Oscillospiraceae bacterium]